MMTTQIRTGDVYYCKVLYSICEVVRHHFKVGYDKLRSYT